MYSVAQDLTA